MQTVIDQVTRLIDKKDYEELVNLLGNIFLDFGYNKTMVTLIFLMEDNLSFFETLHLNLAWPRDVINAVKVGLEPDNKINPYSLEIMLENDVDFTIPGANNFVFCLWNIVDISFDLDRHIAVWHEIAAQTLSGLVMFKAMYFWAQNFPEMWDNIKDVFSIDNREDVNVFEGRTDSLVNFSKSTVLQEIYREIFHLAIKYIYRLH
jgi:hypothetical protein